MPIYQTSYRNWETARLQQYARNVLADVMSNMGGTWRYPWLPAVFPEYVNESGFAPWNYPDNPPSAYTDDGEALRARVARAGGFLVIGFDPAGELAALQAHFPPPFYRPDANGNFTFEATPNQGDFLGTLLLVTGAAIVTAGAAGAFAGGASAAEAGAGAAGFAGEAGGTYAGTTLTAGEITGSTAAAASESVLGPATGEIFGPGVQASGAIVSPVAGVGAPTVAGVAEGGGAFIDAATGLALPAVAPATTDIIASAATDAVKGAAGSALKNAAAGKVAQVLKSLFSPAPSTPALQSASTVPSSAATQAAGSIIPVGLAALALLFVFKKVA